jgi:hypothetical protein
VAQIDECGTEPFSPSPFFSNELEKRIVNSHSEKCGKFLMRHSLLAVFHKIPDRFLEVAMFGEPSRVPDPETLPIEFGNFSDGQELPGVVIARIVTVFVKPTNYG